MFLENLSVWRVIMECIHASMSDLMGAFGCIFSEGVVSGSGW
jgi:hypothetical protein